MPAWLILGLIGSAALTAYFLISGLAAVPMPCRHTPRWGTLRCPDCERESL